MPMAAEYVRKEINHKLIWERPRWEEILLNCEINSYAPAEL